MGFISDDLPLFPAVTTYYGFAILILFGYIRDFFGKLFGFITKPKKGYAPLLANFEDFYIRRLYFRIEDAWNRPIASCPGPRMDVLEREMEDKNKLTGTKRNCINLGSYNYLGFADPDSPTGPAVQKALEQYSVTTCSSRVELGTSALHAELEQLVSRFLGKPATMIFGMGYGTNSTALPCLVGKGDLLLSDKLNHASIVTGARLSGAKIKPFAHNDPADLERVIRKAIVEGQPRTHRPWRRILIVVEGVYSMEGHVCKLPEIVALKKKYKCYLYLDEAHSIGALGKTGRGVCEHTGVDTADVDIMMGTFTKSFGAVGGYITSTHEVIRALRRISAGSMYSPSISPPCVQQIISAFKIVMGEDGTDIGQTKITALKENANYFRKGCIDMGCVVLGNDDSPVVPVMLGDPAKISAFSRECFKEDLAVVVVGFPATPIYGSRVRFCISAGHTKADLKEALDKLKKVCKRVHVRYKRHMSG